MAGSGQAVDIMVERNRFIGAQKGLSVAFAFPPSRRRVNQARLDVLRDRRRGGGRHRARAEDLLLIEEGLVKGSMQVLDADGATRLYAQMSQARETSGGSAANTMAGVAALGGRAGFVGQVADDQLGEIFIHDIRAPRRRVPHPAEDRAAQPTGRCLILVTA